MSRDYFDRYQFFIDDGNFRIVPGIDIVIKGTLNGTLSTVSVQLGYVNSSEDQPIECTFDFPINSKSIVS